MRILTAFFLIRIAIGFPSAIAQVPDTAKAKTDSQNSQPVTVSLPETIQFKDITEKKEESSWDDNMPWVIALIIGIASAGVTLWLGNTQLKSAERSLQKQIDSAKENAIIDFKSTIASKNRQDWINDLRETLSNLIATASSVAFLVQNDEMTDDKKAEFFRLMIFYDSKIRLLLINPEKEEQKNILEKIEALTDQCFKQGDDFNVDELEKAITILVNASRVLLNSQWKKIKKLD